MHYLPLLFIYGAVGVGLGAGKIRPGPPPLFFNKRGWASPSPVFMDPTVDDLTGFHEFHISPPGGWGWARRPPPPRPNFFQKLRNSSLALTSAKKGRFLQKLKESRALDLLVSKVGPLLAQVGERVTANGSLYDLKRQSIYADLRYRKALFFGLPESIIKAKVNLPQTLLSGKKTLLSAIKRFSSPKKMMMMGWKPPTATEKTNTTTTASTPHAMTEGSTEQAQLQLTTMAMASLWGNNSLEEVPPTNVSSADIVDIRDNPEEQKQPSTTMAAPPIPKPKELKQQHPPTAAPSTLMPPEEPVPSSQEEWGQVWPAYNDFYYSFPSYNRRHFYHYY